MAVGQHRQIVHKVAVEVAHGHGYAQLAPLISLRVFHIVPRMIVIVAHQQTVALAALGKLPAVAIVIPLLNLAAAGVVILGGIDHDTLLAIAVKVTGHDIEEATVGIGRYLKVISVEHITETADLHPRAAV